MQPHILVLQPHILALQPHICCDRGKTKSTPSPKTENWPLDWSLTKSDIQSQIREGSQTKNVTKNAKSPKGGGISAKNQ